MNKNVIRLPNFPDYNNCLVNLANSVLKKFGVKNMANTLTLADKYLAKDYKNVVVFLFDALGTSIMERHLEEDGFFRSHCVGSYHSVYPPTTVAATTSLISGLYPNEHGWLGWDMYYPELGKNVTVFLNTDQAVEKEGAVPTAIDRGGNKKWGADSLKEKKQAADYKAGLRFTPYQTIIDKINDAGGKAYFSMPYTAPYPKSLDAILKRVEKLCNEPGNKYIYAYWNEPDATMHATGTTSRDARDAVVLLERKIEKFVSGLSDTLFLITADHGHIDSNNLCILDYPEITKRLARLPSIEPRTLNLFVKEEYRKSFSEAFEKAFGDAFFLMSREDAIGKKLFGTGKDRDGLEDLIGDYVAVAVSNVSIFKTHYEAQEMRGVHAGMTPEEYVIPLIVIEK